MFKRANKITSLLLAAAAVASLVPAYASDVKKIDSEDGTIYNAVAYKDGKALIDGEVNDNDAAYYYSDGKYNELDDVDSGSDYFAYGDKYAKVNEDGDYFVDLTDGSVTDDDLDNDDIDDAASALRKKVKGVDRYGNDSGTIADLTLIPGNKFGESWYEVSKATSNNYKVDLSKYKANSLIPTIYTDKNGNYIDADYSLGKIKFETTSASATIENTIDSEDLDKTGTTTNVSAKVTYSKTLGQDKDYVYRIADIEFTVAGGTNDVVKINNKEFTLSGGKIKIPAIQKISKAQNSDDVEEAKYAKTVYNYFITDDTGKTATKASDFNALARATATGNIEATKATLINGKIVLYSVENASSASSGRADTVIVSVATLKQKNGYYYTDIEDRATITPEYSSDLQKTAFDTDVDGNIYVLDGGYIKEFDGTDDWNKVYKVDGSFDSLSVYDKDDMVSWNEDDEAYSIIGGKKTDDSTTPVVKAGWVQASDGTWSFNKADGTKTIGWIQDGGNWYYTNASGIMQTGWINDYGTWYYLNPNSDGTKGAMMTGWQKIGGLWYYLNPVSDGSKGAMKTGWINDNGTWYYCNSYGAMLANTTVNGYKLGSNGAWIR